MATTVEASTAANNAHSDAPQTEYHLDIRQQPRQARMCGSGEKADRRPIDPPPIVRLRIRKPSSTANSNSKKTKKEDEFTCPTLTHTLFCFASLVGEHDDEELYNLGNSKAKVVTGSVVSSLFHLKDQSCFVFPDLSVRTEGRWRFKMSLYEIVEDGVHFCSSIFTDTFQVYSSKRFPGMGQSTELSKAFAQQGLRLRIRRPGPSKNGDEEDDEPEEREKEPTPRQRKAAGRSVSLSGPAARAGATSSAAPGPSAVASSSRKRAWSGAEHHSAPPPPPAHPSQGYPPRPEDRFAHPSTWPTAHATTAAYAPPFADRPLPPPSNGGNYEPRRPVTAQEPYARFAPPPYAAYTNSSPYPPQPFASDNPSFSRSYPSSVTSTPRYHPNESYAPGPPSRVPPFPSSSSSRALPPPHPTQLAPMRSRDHSDSSGTTLSNAPTYPGPGSRPTTAGTSVPYHQSVSRSPEEGFERERERERSRQQQQQHHQEGGERRLSESDVRGGEEEVEVERPSTAMASASLAKLLGGGASDPKEIDTEPMFL